MNVFKKIGKFIKRLLITVLIIVLIPVVAILLHPFWAGPVVTTAANKVVPGKVKTDFRLDKFNLNLYKCFFEAGDLRLANPEGFDDPDALKLGTLLVDVDTLSLASDVIVIEKVELSDVYVSYIRNNEGKFNFEVIADNCKSAETKAAEAEAQAAEAETGTKFEIPDLDKFKFGKKKGEAAPEAETAKAEKKPVKIIIKEFTVRNISGKYMQMPFRVPSISLHNMGADSGGYEVEVMGQAILKELVASIMAGMTDILNGAVDLTGKGIEALGNVSLESATESLNNVGQAATESLGNVGQGATEVLSNVGQGAGDVLSNVGQGAGDVLSNVGQGTGDTLSNVGQGATDAVNSVGSAAMDVINSVDTQAAKDALKGAGDELKNAGKALKGLFK